MTRIVRAARWTWSLALCAACASTPPSALPGDDAVVHVDALDALDAPSVVACTPGLSVTCNCAGGARGQRLCMDDGTYSACACVDARVPCFSGAVQGCDCGGFAGIQFCGEDGVFTGCMCPMARDAGPAMDAADVTDATDAARMDGGLDAADAAAPLDRPDAAEVARDVAPDLADVCTCTPDASRLCPLPPGQVPQTYTFGRCRRGTQVCAGASCWGPCIGQVEPIEELCNNIDDNCNGLVDDITVSCGLGRCRRVMQTCDMGRFTPCIPDYSQRQPESCNNVDDDCNGMIDDGCRDL